MLFHVRQCTEWPHADTDPALKVGRAEGGKSASGATDGKCGRETRRPLRS